MPGTLTISTLSDGTNSTSATNPIRGSARAWVNFTPSSATVLASYNVSSVTRTSQGSYTINFTTAFADANYSTCATLSIDGSVNYWGTSEVNAPTASAAYLRCYTGSGTYDPAYASASFFR